MLIKKSTNLKFALRYVFGTGNLYFQFTLKFKNNLNEFKSNILLSEHYIKRLVVRQQEYTQCRLVNVSSFH